MIGDLSMPDFELLTSAPQEAWNSPGFCQVPNVLIDGALDILGLAELKVIIFIIRRTLGFNKLSDRISISQFEKGICTRNGRWLNHGTGLCRKSINRALNSLEKSGLIKRIHQRTAQGVWLAPVYQVCFDAIPAYAAAQSVRLRKKAPQPLEPGAALAPLLAATGTGKADPGAEDFENEDTEAKTFEAENFENETFENETFEVENFENEDTEAETFENESCENEGSAAEDFEENLTSEINLTGLNMESFDKPDPWAVLPIEALKAAEPDRNGSRLTAVPLLIMANNLEARSAPNNLETRSVLPEVAPAVPGNKYNP
jgi:hypothetical protein